MEKEKDFLEGEISEKSKRTLAILEVLRRRGPLSRMDISKTIGINPVTVSNYIDRLIAHDVIYEKEFDVSTGGRRPMLLDLNPDAGYVLGVGINLFDAVGVVTNLDGKVIYRYKKEGSVATPNAVIETIISVIENLLSSSQIHLSKVKGIGVGVGGVVDKKRGVIRWPQKANHSVTYTYITMPLQGYLENKYNVPVFVDNDATLACFAEHWFSLDANIRNVVYMFSGVGAGLVLNSEIYTGVSGCAGELFINIAPNEANCFFGDCAILSQWDKDLYLVERTNQLLQTEGISVETIEEVFGLAARHIAVKELIYEAARALAIKIAFLVNLLNPEVVIIGGGMEKGGFEFIERINHFVRKYAFEEMTKDLRIVPSSLGDDSVALGAASLVVRNIFTSI